jgi:hypothetical protein
MRLWTRVASRETRAHQGPTGPLAAPPPAPAAQAAGERRGRPYVSALLTARATATHRQHGIDAWALRRLTPRPPASGRRVLPAPLRAANPRPHGDIRRRSAARIRRAISHAKTAKRGVWRGPSGVEPESATRGVCVLRLFPPVLRLSGAACCCLLAGACLRCVLCVCRVPRRR